MEFALLGSQALFCRICESFTSVIPESTLWKLFTYWTKKTFPAGQQCLFCELILLKPKTVRQKLDLLSSPVNKITSASLTSLGFWCVYVFKSFGRGHNVRMDFFRKETKIKHFPSQLVKQWEFRRTDSLWCFFLKFLQESAQALPVIFLKMLLPMADRSQSCCSQQGLTKHSIY